MWPWAISQTVAQKCAAFTKLELQQMPCLYFNQYVFVVFIDDILILNHPTYRQEARDFDRKLMELFEMRDLGDLIISPGS